MDRKEAIEYAKFRLECHTKGDGEYTDYGEFLVVAIAALQEPERSYDEIMVGDIIKNFGCEYEVHSMSHIKDELFISAYRIRGEEE